MSNKRTMAARAARRLAGFQGEAKAAKDNAERLFGRVLELSRELDTMEEAQAALAKTVQEQAGQIESLRGTMAQFDQSARDRMDSLSGDICGLSGRICLLEEAARPAPAAEPGTVAEPETDASIEPEYVCPPSHDDE